MGRTFESIILEEAREVIMSEGIITMVEVLFSTPISVSICNRRSSNAAGFSAILRAASANSMGV